MNLKQIKNKLQSNIELVLNKLDIEYEILGDNIYSKCPIHEGSDNTRAFSYSIDKNIWKCWTRDCQEHYNNDVFGLIQGALSSSEGKELTFSDTLKWACKSFGIKQPRDHEQVKTNQQDDKDPFCELIDIMSNQYKEKEHTSIKIDFDINYPSEYFISRGFKKSTMKHFGIGDCSCEHALSNRAIIPIHDDDGKNIVGLLGRSVKEYKLPKFLFYPKGFDKRYFFYNYHRALKKISETNVAFIVEGQGDVWKLYEAGVENAISIFGKTITKEQEYKLSKLPVTTLIVLTDSDQAGREAKTQIKRQFSRMYKLIFPKINGKDIGDMKIKEVKIMLENLKGLY